MVARLGVLFAVALAALLYSAVRGLWVARQGLGQPGEAGTHAVDWRFDIRLWHWHWYVVVGRNRGHSGAAVDQGVAGALRVWEVAI